MTERLEAFSVRKYTTNDGEVKSAWTRIGVAFSQKDGKGWSVQLDAVPAPTIKDGGEARYEIVLRPPMPKDGKPKPSKDGGDLDDEIPF